MRVADYIMFRIVKLGIKQVFFLPGGGAMHLNDALASNKQLEPVLCLHEQACGIAAEGAGKLLGGPSACLVTSGPGATNVLTATLAAWLDSTPVFFISGQVKTADLKTGTALRILGVQEVDIISMASPVTKKAITLLNPYDVAYVFDELEIAALSGALPMRDDIVWTDSNTLGTCRFERVINVFCVTPLYNSSFLIQLLIFTCANFFCNAFESSYRC